MSDFKKTKLIVEDFLYWFKGEKAVELILFCSGTNPKDLIQFYSEHKPKVLPTIRFLSKPLPPQELYKFYKQRFLLNEWVNYKQGDIFRIYKLIYPLEKDTSFDNQPIAIQYDIRYHAKRNDEYKSYFPGQLSHIVDALNFYKPGKMIDVGCGSGAQFYFLKEALKKYKTHYTGIDTSRFQLMKAIDLYSSDSAHFLLDDATNLDFERGYFDLGFSESTLMFIDNPLKALMELDRVCKNGFFASVYTLKGKQELPQMTKKGDVYFLNTGATWKYYNKITPNEYKLPKYSKTMELSENFKNSVIVRNDSDQFFEPLGLQTANLFFFPKRWYKQAKTRDFPFRPLM